MWQQQRRLFLGAALAATAFFSANGVRAETKEIQAAPTLSEQETRDLIRAFAPSVPEGAAAAFVDGEASSPAMVAAAEDLRAERQPIVISVSALAQPSEGGEAVNLVEIVIYDYKSNTSRILVVDKDSKDGKAIRSEREVAGADTPFHLLEAETAHRIAQRDRRVGVELARAAKLGGENTALEFPGFVAPAGDPLEKHRLMEIYFRTPRGYYNPGRQFIVDLTEARVIVREPRH